VQIQILIPPLPPWEKTNCSSGPRGPPSIIARLSARLCAVCHLSVTRHWQIGHRQRILTTNEQLRAPPAATLALSRRAAGSRPTTAASVDAGRARAAERARERHRPGGPRTRRNADRTRSTPNRRPSRRAHARRDARSIRAWRPRPSREFGPGGLTCGSTDYTYTNTVIRTNTRSVSGGVLGTRFCLNARPFTAYPVTVVPLVARSLSSNSELRSLREAGGCACGGKPVHALVVAVHLTPRGGLASPCHPRQPRDSLASLGLDV
jgi:hypothetical protein